MRVDFFSSGVESMQHVPCAADRPSNALNRIHAGYIKLGLEQKSHFAIETKLIMFCHSLQCVEWLFSYATKNMREKFNFSIEFCLSEKT